MSEEIGTEIATIEQTMRSDLAAYQRDGVMQDRYLSLLRARDAGAVMAPSRPPAVERELAEIEKTMRTDLAGYQKNAELQARYLELLRQRDSAAATATADADDLPRIPTRSEIAAQLEKELGRRPVPGEVQQAMQNTLNVARFANDVVIQVPADARAAFQATFDALPDAVIAASAAEMLDGMPWAGPVSHEALQAFRRLPEGEALCREWGPQSSLKLSIIQQRLDRWLGRMRTEGAMTAALRWFDGLSTAEARAVLRAVAG